jgi:hypothetical protein
LRQLVGRDRHQQRFGIDQGAQVAQASGNPPGRLGRQRHQAGPGFAGLGQQDRLAAMGGIDQA